MDINDLMSDVEYAIEYSLNGNVISCEDICAKVRALVVPALEGEKQEVEKRDTQIMKLSVDAFMLTEKVAEQEKRIRDLIADKRRLVIRQLNILTNAEKVCP